jgi:SP family general alpha glucoside:H+ symporter-like MFS transporter
VQLFIGIDQLAANLILKGTGTLNSALAYKIPFILQFIFHVFLLIGLPFCPDSPWFLAPVQKTDKAIETFFQLRYPSPDTALAEILKMTALKLKKASSTSYIDRFCGSNF